MQDIAKLISLALLSAYIEEEKPLSLMLVSKVESGKSALLTKFSDVPNVVMPSDVTAWGIAKHYGDALRKGKIRHILIPEFSIPISRNWDTVKSLDTYLCGLIEEGVGEIVSYKWRFATKAPYGCGVILCISNQDFKKQEANWFRIGLMSRVIPVSYDYKTDTQAAIKEYIKQRQYRKESKINFPIPQAKIPVTLPLPMANKLEKMVNKLITGTELYGFRWQRHLQRLAMANAVLNNRTTVELTDVETVRHLKKYMNVDCDEKI